MFLGHHFRQDNGACPSNNGSYCFSSSNLYLFLLLNAFDNKRNKFSTMSCT